MTARVETTERIKESDRSVGATRFMELFVKHTPGVKCVHDGSGGDTPSDVFIRRYKLPPVSIPASEGFEVIDGPVIGFLYNRRDGRAHIIVNERDTMDEGTITKIFQYLSRIRVDVIDDIGIYADN
jgi:hypothetical protein